MSTVQRLASLALAGALVAGAVLTRGDLRTLLVVAAVVAGLPVILPMMVVLLASLTADWGDNEPARPISRSVARWVGLAIAVVLAAAGVAWYVLAPGVASYQFGTVLILPALGIVLWWLHRHLPRRVQWALAAVVAPIGPVGYLVFGGSEWWAAYSVTVLPLAALLASGASRSPTAQGGSSVPGWIDGPWGPP